MKLTFLEMMGIFPGGINPSKDKLNLYDFEELSFLEEEYNKHAHFLSQTGTKKIPKILHTIWLGPKPFPESSIKNVLSWKKYHPDWELYFWTDTPSRPCPIDAMKKKLVQEYDFGQMNEFIQMSTNWGEKADLMRYVIIHDQGGFYVDHDLEFLHTLEPLLQFDSVVSCEYPHWHGGLGGSSILFQIGLFGAIPKHPFLKKTVKNIKSLWHELDQKYPDNDNPTPPWKVIRRTFDSFTLAIKSELIKEEHRKKFTDMILPACYFVPKRILSSQDIERFYKQGVVWALHEYASLWVEGEWGEIVEKL